MQCNYSRALAHIASCGSEGNTPYFVADLHALLAERYEKVLLSSVAPSPLRVEFNIDGRVVHVEEETEAAPRTCLRIKGLRTVRVDPLRSIKTAPQHTFIDRKEVEFWEPFYLNWMDAWPKANDSFESFMRKTFGATVAWTTTDKVTYWSECLVADGIAAALA